jgi:hypothetical protein
MNPEIVEKLTLWAEWIGGVILVASPFVFAFQFFAKKWQPITRKTPNPYDDRVADGFVWLGNLLTNLVLALPKVTMNLAALRDIARAFRGLPRPPSALLVLLVIFPLATTGCSMTQTEKARYGLGATLEIVNQTDAVFTPRYEAAMARARSGDVPADEVAAFRRRWDAASISIESTLQAVATAETTLDAIERGASGDVPGVMACVGVALIDLLERLPDVGVELPSEVEGALRVVMLLAGDRCRPPPSAPSDPPSSDAELSS